MFLLQTVDTLFFSAHKASLLGPRMHFTMRVMMIAIVMLPITRMLSRLYEAIELSANLNNYPSSVQRIRGKITILEHKKVAKV
jgi:hypothetical protein